MAVANPSSWRFGLRLRPYAAAPRRNSTSLADFVTYVQTHLTGDEKGEDADFLWPERV